MSILGPTFFPKGVVVEHFYYEKGLRQILDFCQMIPIPCLEETTSTWKKKQLAHIRKKIGEELIEGGRYLLYPAGKLKLTGWEKLGGASLVHGLLQEAPKTTVVLIRTTGLWGSSFSKYGKDRSPPFGPVLWEGVKALIKGFFVIPKRDVRVEFEVLHSLNIPDDRLVFNKSLEEWYNRYPDIGAEKPRVIPYSYFFSSKTQEYQEKQLDVKDEIRLEIPEKIENHVISYLSDLSKVSKDKITRNSHLAFDLGLDSLSVADVHVFLDKYYDAGAASISSLKTVADVLRAIVQKDVYKKTAPEQEKKIIGWEEKKQRKLLAFSEAETIQGAFLDSCDRMGSCIACADRLSGALTYKRLKQTALILALEFKNLPGEKVGVLLPSSVGAYLCIMGLLLCNKVPVMLNWTAGRSSLDHAKKIGGFEATLTSKKFLDKIYLEELGEVEDTFVFLEDIKQNISFFSKVKGCVAAMFSSCWIENFFGISKNPSDTAVILFTSGTEAMPKSVPLEHRHILANQRSALEVAKLHSADILQGSLPPFHSFGFSLTGIFPLLCGLKVFYAPDPTDGYSMAADIGDKKITIMCLAPSFIRNIFAVAKIEQLQSLRLIVSGAEKPSPDLPEFVQKYIPQALWIEGYGITECSPIVSLQPPSGERKGVGQTLAGIEVRTIDPYTKEPLAQYVEGELCFRGPSVFEGYADNSPNPFIDIEGKKWYRSGDLGRIDENKNIYLSDRLKRTVKIGGEMISLSFIEQELLHAAKEKSWYTLAPEGPSLAVIAFSLDEKIKIILCSAFPVSLEDVNLALRERGAGRIVKVAAVAIFSEIPVMGTGKVHYRRLEEQVRGMHVI
jgi:long-chain-fatty-acid--[acyl-carrier-protein] ligase